MKDENKEKINFLFHLSEKTEIWAKKASIEVEKGTVLGRFYVFVLAISSTILTLLAISIIVPISSLLKEPYNYIIGPILILVILFFLFRLLYFCIKKEKAQ